MEKEMATHSSILAWRILWIEEPGRLQFIGLQRAGHDWSDLAHTYLLVYGQGEIWTQHFLASNIFYVEALCGFIWGSLKVANGVSTRATMIDFEIVQVLICV